MPENAAGEQRVPPIMWAFLLCAALLLLGGWLLPWFVEPTANGVGLSPQDVSTRGPALSLVPRLIDLAGIAMLVVVINVSHDLFAAIAHRSRPFRFGGVAGVTAVGGTMTTVAAWYAAVHNTGTTGGTGGTGTTGSSGFGAIGAQTVTSASVWMFLMGFLLAAFACLLSSWIDRHAGLAFGVVAFCIGGAFPFTFHTAGDFVSWGAQSAAIYVLLALGLNVVVGYAGLLDLGYAAFYAIGAYTTASFASSAHNIHLPFWTLIFLGAAVAALFGVILGAPTLRLRGDYLAIVTLGFGEIVPDLATNNVFNLTGGPNGLSGIDSPSFPTHANPIIDFGQVGSNPAPYFYALLVLIVVVMVALRNLQHSRIGRAWMAIREDEVAAAASGINPVTTKLLAFAIGASVSGLAGAFFGAMLGSVTPETFQFQVSVTALSTVVLGGIGSLSGVTVGAVLIALVIFWVLPHLQSWMGTVSDTVHAPALAGIDYAQYKLVVYGAILIGVMLLRPAGLFPSRTRRVELGGNAAPALELVDP